ncbi:MAG TPA: MFS transporter, partial [Thermomicrobiaceae bacterium]|nr:MFS transporter [Thermomicrobiaceae bacterium]
FIFAETSWSFILLRAIQGAGVAMVYPALRALIADVTPSNRLGQAFAGYGAAFNAGLLFGPLLGGILAAPIGVNALFLAAAGVEVGVALASLVLLRDKGARHERAEVSQIPIRALIVRPLIGAFILSFSNQFQMGLFSGIWSIYLADRGASDFLIGLSFTTYSIAYLIMAPMGGRQADSGKRWFRLLVSNLTLGCIMVSYGLLPSVLLILLMGLVEGAVTTVAQPSADAYLASVADPRVMGRVQGMYATIGMAGAAISAFLGSALYAIGHVVPFVTAGGVAWILTFVAVYFIRQTEVRIEREGHAVQVSVAAELELATPSDGPGR